MLGIDGNARNSIRTIRLATLILSGFGSRSQAQGTEKSVGCSSWRSHRLATETEV
jgi:hypothetical protein